MAEENAGIEELAISKADMGGADVRDLRAQNLPAYCSIKAESAAEKALVYNAANNPTHKVNDFINKEILLKDIYAENIELANEETGEVENAPRIVLIDADGESYQCVSKGMFGAIQKLISIFGEPTWEEPIRVVVKQPMVKRGSMLTLEVVA